MKNKKLGTFIVTLAMLAALTGCGAATSTSTATSSTSASTSTSSGTKTASGTLIDTTDLFSDRELAQTADTTDAKTIALTEGQDVSITEEGVYVITGNANDVTITVDAPDDAKVQIVLDGVNITNEDAPAIYVKTADKVFVTTTDSENTLEVTGTYTADGDTNTDAVIFSKSDLVLNGTGTLTVKSGEGNGISTKDDLTITGGTYNITASADGIEANDSISVYAGAFTVDSGKDAFHSENNDDNSLGSIYIKDGTFNIKAGDNGIQATTTLQIDGGTINLTDCVEGLEATYIQINGGTLDINAQDDGINASAKSTSYDVVVEINGGDLTIVMASGDTDALDANGDIYVNGGTIDITCNSAFDFDNTGELNGGTVTVNGAAYTEMVEQQMGGGGMGGQKGGGFNR